MIVVGETLTKAEKINNYQYEIKPGYFPTILKYKLFSVEKTIS
jgi:hypothetical protein